MGIYNNNKFYGIKIFNYDNDVSNLLLEVKYNETMTYGQKNEVFLFYNNISNKETVSFQVYTECSCTLDKYRKDNYMVWQSLSLKSFLEYFSA